VVEAFVLIQTVRQITGITGALTCPIASKTQP
jgi:hypothetical protein